MTWATIGPKACSAAGGAAAALGYLAGLDRVDDDRRESRPARRGSARRRVRSTVRVPLSSEPSTATPTTEPSSRLVVVAPAAMPECSAGTTASATEVTGTTATPKPRPARASAGASVAKLDVAAQRHVGSQHADAGGEAADHGRQARPGARHPASGQRRGGDHGGRHGHEQGGRAVGGVADHDLQVERREEEDREDAEVGGEGDRQGAGERRVAQVGGGRRSGPALRCSTTTNRHGRHGAHHEQRDDRGVAVAGGLAVDDGEDRGAERDRAEDEAGDVDAARLRVGALGHGDVRGEQDEQAGDRG